MNESENLEIQSNPDVAAPGKHPRKKMTGKERGLLWGSLGLVAVLVAGGAAFAVPQIIHSNQVSQYSTVLAETNKVTAQTAQDKASEQAAIELVQLADDAARTYATQLTALGTTAAPILTADSTAALKKSAEALTKTLGDAPKPKTESAKLPLSLAFQERLKADKETADRAVAQVQEQQKKDLAAAKDDAAKAKINEAATAAIDEAQAHSFPANALDLTVAQSVELLKLDASVTAISPVPDDQVNGEVLDQAKKDRDNALAAAKKQTKALDSVQQELDSLHQAVSATVQPLLAAANEAPAQVKEVIAAAPKAAADKQAAATDSASAAQDSITGNAEKEAAGKKKPEDKAKKTVDTKSDKTGEKPATVVVELKTEQTPARVLALVTSYTAAAKAVTDHHAAVLAEEAAQAAAAAAAAAGASGYTDPSTGGWVDNGNSGWSGSGNGGSGGSSSSGGGGTGGSGGTGGDGGSGSAGGTPESWFISNCKYGYWWSNGNGGCHPNPDPDGWD